jgi:hypothetical protein
MTRLEKMQRAVRLWLYLYSGWINNMHIIRKTGTINKAAEMKFFKTCSRLYKNVLNSSKWVAEKLKIFDLNNIFFQYRSELKYYVSQT